MLATETTPTIQDLNEMDLEKRMKWQSSGGRVMTPHGVAKVYADSSSNGKIVSIAAFLDDRSQVFYAREIGWETETEHSARMDAERIAQMANKRKRRTKSPK